jgi:signal transduction histidine kinase
MKSNYIKIFIFSIILLIVPVTILQYGIKLISAIDKSNDYDNAETLIKDDYKDIDLKRIKDSDGAAQIVTKDLKAIVLCGKGIFKDGSISEKEWNNYLLEIVNRKIDTNDNYYSIAYSAYGKYWLIVSYKNNAFITLTILNDTYESNNVKGAMWIVVSLIMAIVSYIVSVFGVIYVYSYRTSRQLIKQIQSLKDYTIMLQNGEYKRRITMPMDKEILELKEAFNDLADSLEKEKAEKRLSEESKERLLLDISHDLNNPIATIRSSSEILMKKEIDTNLIKKYYEIIHNNSVRANELLKTLFDYVRIDGPSFRLCLEKIDLCEFIRLELIRYQSEFDAAHMKLEGEVPEKEIFINMDVTQMKHVIYNLLTNAIKFNKAGTAVNIKIEECDNSIKLHVKDDGIGIDKKICKTIFEPFTRADESRNSKTGGSGLGLAIVKKIIRSHGFNINLVTGLNLGCTFIIEMPYEE